ncbi:MAG: MarR family transcriptional regulator [Sphingomonadales bacterium]|nr:MarR family transcriptional regulator [Sphingomonadales bacterium]
MLLDSHAVAEMAGPVPDPVSGSLCHELRRASVAVMAAMAGEFGQAGLKPSEATLLMHVGAHPGCTSSAIARAYRIKPNNLVPLIARLEREGLIDRVAGEGRAIALTVSAAGRAVLEQVEAGFARLEGALGAGFPAEQRPHLVAALRAICDAACGFETRARIPRASV